MEKITPKGKLPGTIQGNVLIIPGFGKLSLAELIVDSNSYRLSMFRLELLDARPRVASVAEMYREMAAQNHSRFLLDFTPICSELSKERIT